MLGVGLRKLCPLDSFGKAFQEKKTVRKSTPEGAKPARGGSKMACGRPPDGVFYASVPNLAAKAARKPSLGGSWDALGPLLALLEPSWAFWAAPGASWAAPGRLLGVVEGIPESDLDDLDDVCGATCNTAKTLYFVMFWGCQSLPEKCEIAPKSAREAS